MEEMGSGLEDRRVGPKRPLFLRKHSNNTPHVSGPVAVDQQLGNSGALRVAPVGANLISAVEVWSMRTWMSLARAFVVLPIQFTSLVD